MGQGASRRGKSAQKVKSISRRRRIRSTAPFLCLLCMLCMAQMVMLFTGQVEGQQDIIVTIESPREGKEFTVEEIIPIRITVRASNGSAIENATVEVTTLWDDQWVHVAFLEVISKDESEVAVYAPDPNYPVPHGQVSEDTLIELNNNGFLRLPVSEGEWLIILLVKPLSPNYNFYQEKVAIHVHAPGPPVILYVLAIGWVSVIIIAVLLVKKRKKHNGKRASA